MASIPPTTSGTPSRSIVLDVALQLGLLALLLYACARLASPSAQWRWLSALTWWLATVGLALSGAPWIGLVLGGGWLLWSLAGVCRARKATRDLKRSYFIYEECT